ncbi:MAG: hypothetical protein A2287_06575 [Candidatus Melainabacteria bacterium RIFOXYA12_FULL_32_12]|nr:MAG: hypothetical protein A2255_09640 [Candidatus Melainabacteria bacterium RIFOXYA2_FULL_32_9]OGI26893.1 MAG: hypothetical protein A2287_06575 [Candidatus Melainabacteria bacterium RIFOXYA12_FULL_32_12]
MASFKGKLVYIGINENNINDVACMTSLKVKKDINSNKEAISQIKEYLARERKTFNIETEFLIGSEFQRKVWNELAKIPYGKTISYKQLANNIGNPNASRAVGNANSKNPIPVIFPCHRVINSDGGLGGFSGGVKIKEFLLNLEFAN